MFVNAGLDFDFCGRRVAAHNVRPLTRNVPEFDHSSVSEHAVCEAHLCCVFLRGDAGTAKQGERRDVLTLVRDVSVFGVQVWSNGNTRPLRQSPRRIIVC